MVCSKKHVFFSAVKQELAEENYYIAEILMPIEIYWETKELLGKADFLSSHSDDTVQVQDLYKKIFRKLSPFAAFEKDRIWLLRSGGVR